MHNEPREFIQLDIEESEDVMDLDELHVPDLLESHDRDYELSSSGFYDDLEDQVDQEIAAMDARESEMEVLEELTENHMCEGTLWEGLD